MVAPGGTGINTQVNLGGDIAGGGGNVEQEGQPIGIGIGTTGVDGQMSGDVGTETGDA